MSLTNKVEWNRTEYMLGSLDPTPYFPVNFWKRKNISQDTEPLHNLVGYKLNFDKYVQRVLSAFFVYIFVGKSAYAFLLI